MLAKSVDSGTEAQRPLVPGWERARSVVEAHSFVILLLSLTFVTRLLWAAAVPLWQIPDEINHFAYIQSLGENLALSPEEFVSQEIGEVERLTTLGGVPFHPEITQEFSPGSLEGPAEHDVKELPHDLRKEPTAGRPNSAAGYPPGYYLVGSIVYRLTAA